MEEKTFSVPSISCQHCVMHIRREVAGIQGVADVTADATTKQVTVRWQPPANWPMIRTALAEIGYPPAE